MSGCKRLFTLGTIKSTQGPIKCDWLLNLSRDHFGLHQEKNGQSDHGIQGPQKTYFKASIIH